MSDLGDFLGQHFFRFFGFLADILFAHVLKLRPRVHKVDGALIADTALHVAILTLGLKLRRVMIDPKQKAVRIFARYGWFFPKVRHIPFHAVECVLYTYSELNGAINPLSGWSAYQEREMFAVRLRLVDGEEPLLCRFYGSGSFVNNSILPDWLYWDEMLTAPLAQGDQEEVSRCYASAVAALIGVELQNS